MDSEWTALLRDSGAVAVPWAIVGACITAIVRGWLIPRKSHEEIVNGYKERAAAAEEREQWWRAQAHTGTLMADRSLDLATDLATRRRIIASTRVRGVDFGADDGDT